MGSTIYVDADACPVKEETVRVAERHDVAVVMVSDGGVRPIPSPRVEIVVVAEGPDAADDWIAERTTTGDVVITNDIPLADRCIKSGAAVVRPNGEALTARTIGDALATRNLMAGLRETGAVTGGPRPFSKADRSRFLQALDAALRSAQR